LRKRRRVKAFPLHEEFGFGVGRFRAGNSISIERVALAQTSPQDVRACSVLLADEDSWPYYSLMNYQDIITIEPGKRGGKPCIRGMRITVYDVLEYMASGMSHDEVLNEFPYLTEEDILACLAYAADREKHLLVTTE
jgi:uncharacterized protein (DUF433 family)